MTDILFRQVVRTDGHEGHWLDYEPHTCRIEGSILYEDSSGSYYEHELSCGDTILWMDDGFGP